MWLLERDGTLREDQAPAMEIAGEGGEGGDAPADPNPDPNMALAIRFAATQDGRGFSTARRLRHRGHRGRLVAIGPLEPDQARHAFQCGFDAVGVDDATLERHGRAAWENALHTSVTTPYLADPTDRLGAPGIWSLRHRA